MVRLLTYNLALNGRRLGGRWKLSVAAYLDQRLIAAPRLLRTLAADVIALQEVYDPLDQHHLATVLAPTLPHHFVPPGRRSVFGSGLMVLSRFPIRSGAFIPFPNAFLGGHLLWEPGFLTVEIDLPALGAPAARNESTYPALTIWR